MQTSHGLLLGLLRLNYQAWHHPACSSSPTANDVELRDAHERAAMERKIVAWHRSNEQRRRRATIPAWDRLTGQAMGRPGHAPGDPLKLYICGF